MTTHLSFKAGAREANAEPITFDVDGENFTLVENPSVLYLLSIGSLGNLDLDSPDPQEVAQALGSIWDFFSVVLPADDWRRFRRTSVKAGWDVHDLMGILKGIVPELMARPTRRRSDSPPSSSSNGDGSTGDSLSPASTRPS